MRVFWGERRHFVIFLVESGLHDTCLSITTPTCANASVASAAAQALDTEGQVTAQSVSANANQHSSDGVVDLVSDSDESARNIDHTRAAGHGPYGLHDTGHTVFSDPFLCNSISMFIPPLLPDASEVDSEDESGDEVELQLEAIVSPVIQTEVPEGEL